MHAKTKFRCSLRSGLPLGVGSVVGPVLYLVTLAGEIAISVPARFCLAFAASFLIDAVVGCPMRPSEVGVVAALAPVAWSLMALLWPSRCRLWFWRRGARRAGVTEARLLREALESIGVDPELVRDVRVVDLAVPASAVRGRLVAVSRVLVESDALAGALAHEFSHRGRFDGRLTEALGRLGFWADPLRVPEGEDYGDGLAVAVIWQLLRVLVLCAGGRPVERLLAPVWALHWRACEYRADADAVARGWGTELLAYLSECELALDGPQTGLLRGRFSHPPVALRISRLQELLDVDEV